jgi:hypothetical protein
MITKFFLERNFKLAVALITAGFRLKKFGRVIDENDREAPVFHLEPDASGVKANEIAAHSRTNGEILAAEVDAIAEARGITAQEMTTIGFHYALTALQNRATIGIALRNNKALVRRAVGKNGRTSIYREGQQVSDITNIL